MEREDEHVSMMELWPHDARMNRKRVKLVFDSLLYLDAEGLESLHHHSLPSTHHPSLRPTPPLSAATATAEITSTNCSSWEASEAVSTA